MDTEQFKIKIIDMKGRVIISESGREQLNTEFIPTGTYLLQIITGTELRTKLIIKV